MTRIRIFFSLFFLIATLGLLATFVWAALPYSMVVLLVVFSAGLAWILAHRVWRQLESERRFRIYFERAMVGMAVSGPDRRWRVVNPALCTLFGYPAEVLASKTWTEMTHPDDVAASALLFEQLLHGEIDSYELEKRYLRADGQVINALISTQAVFRTDGRAEEILVIIEDITARLVAESALRASEERLRNLGDNLPDSYIFQCARRPGEPLYFIYVSSGVRLIHGYEPEEIIDDPGLLISHADPAQLPDLEAATVESARTLEDFSIELRVRLADASWGWLLLRSRPRRLASGEVIWDGVASNITARREAAAMLDLQAHRAGILLDLPYQSNRLNELQFMQYALSQIEALTGSQIAFMHFLNDDGESIELVTWSSETLEKYCTATFDNHYNLSRAGIWADAARQKQPVIVNDYATAHNRKGLPPGHSALHRLVCVPTIEDGRVRMITGLGNKTAPYTETDVESIQLTSNEVWRIVVQRRAEQALRIATQVVNASPVVCIRRRAAPGWPVIFVSDSIARWGYSVTDLMDGKVTFSDMVHPDDLAWVLGEVARNASEGRNGYDLEYRVLTAGQTVLWVADRTNVLRDAQGEVEFCDGVLTDITERRRQEHELATNLNDQRILNKRLEEAHNQLLQSEKMASIGQLAAGIAHELNNPIGFVHSNLGTLEGYLRDVMEIIDAYDKAAAEQGGDSPHCTAIARLKEDRDFDFIRQDIVQLMSESREGLSRVRKIVQDLKSFSHVSEHDWQWADLHQGLDSTLNIVWNELKYKCKVVKEYGEIPKVYCLISQLNQVFMNLLVNAGHAIEKQGTITLRTSRRNDDQVCVEVIDTGKGIAPEHLSRVFEPFFTTKPVGKGTGLGLSLSYGIVDKHHGRIEVESQVGVGTTFRVILPIEPETGESTGNNTEKSQ